VIPSRGRDTRRKNSQCSEVTLPFPSVEVRPNCSRFSSGQGFARGRHRPVLVVSSEARNQHARRIWRRVGLCSRIGSLMGHRSDLKFGLGSLAGLPTFRRRKHDRCPPSGRFGLRGRIRSLSPARVLYAGLYGRVRNRVRSRSPLLSRSGRKHGSNSLSR
jgi:hypothetical protein